MIESLVHEEYSDREIKKLCETVFNINDRPAQILRLHSLSEIYLERLLFILLSKPERIIGDSRFSYAHKLKLVDSLNGLPEKIVDALRRLTSIRNQCAHSLSPEISDDDIFKLCQPIKKEFNLAVEDYTNDGFDKNIFNAYVWSLFSELSLNVYSAECLNAELNILKSKFK